MKRKPWRTKAQPSQIVQETQNAPGLKVSVDQMISKQPGLIPRMEGSHTRDRIHTETVYIDHFSKYSYSHLQCSTDSDDTLESKQAFERVAESHGVNIKSYHADNGRFAERLFRSAVQALKQTITFCGVGAHHQTGLVE